MLNNVIIFLVYSMKSSVIGEMREEVHFGASLKFSHHSKVHASFRVEEQKSRVKDDVNNPICPLMN